LESCPSFTHIEQTDIDNFLNNALGNSSDITLGKILTQKMLAMPYSNENWNDMRRCDYDTNIFMNWDKSYYYRNTPADSPEKMIEFQIERKFEFPYLYDESQAVAKAYDAACTPDFYFFDDKLDLVYRGQMDDSRPGNQKEITGEDLIIAFENLLSGNPQEELQKPSIGCNIKWKE
jgi:hypothetical protein